MAGDELVSLRRPPGAEFVFVDRRRISQHRVDNSPGRFNFILTGEKHGISLHGVSHQAIVRFHQLMPILAGVKFHQFTFPWGSRRLGANPYGDLNVRAEAEAEVVRGARGKVVPEGLFDVAQGLGKSGCSKGARVVGWEQARRNGQVVKRPLGVAQRTARKIAESV